MREAFEPVYTTLERDPQTADFIARIEELKAETRSRPGARRDSGLHRRVAPGRTSRHRRATAATTRQHSTASTAGRSRPRMFVMQTSTSRPCRSRRRHVVHGHPRRRDVDVDRRQRLQRERHLHGRRRHHRLRRPEQRGLGPTSPSRHDDDGTLHLQPVGTMNPSTMRSCGPASRGSGSTGPSRGAGHGVVGRHLPLDPHQGRRHGRTDIERSGTGAPADFSMGFTVRSTMATWIARMSTTGTGSTARLHDRGGRHDHVRLADEGDALEFRFTADGDGTLHLVRAPLTNPGHMFVMDDQAMGRDRLMRHRPFRRLVAERELGDEARSASSPSTRSVPPNASTRSVRLRSPVPAPGSAPPTPSSTISTVI